MTLFEMHTVVSVLGVVLAELSFAKHILTQMTSTELHHKSINLITPTLTIYSYLVFWEFQTTLSEENYMNIMFTSALS